MKRHAIKDFSSWKMNEGILRKILDFAKELPAVKWLRGLFWNGNEFQGPGSSFFNNFTPVGKAELPKGVVIKPANMDKKILAEAGISVSEKPYFSEADSKISKGDVKMSEAIIPLGSTDETIRDVSYAQFKKAVMGDIRSLRRGVIPSKPVFCWGAPGLGKTSIIYSIANEYDMRVNYANLQNILPEDIFIPNPDKPSTKIPAKWLPVFDQNAPDAKEQEAALNGENGGILFFDELPRAIKQTQDAFIKFIDERELNEWKLASKWIMVAGGNRAEDNPR